MPCRFPPLPGVLWKFVSAVLPETRDMCLHRTQKNMDDTRRLDCRPGEWKSRGFPGLFCGLSVKTYDGQHFSVVASWIGIPVPDEALPPSDRGERSETFSLGGEGYPRGIAKGDAPLAGFLVTLSP